MVPAVREHSTELTTNGPAPSPLLVENKPSPPRFLLWDGGYTSRARRPPQTVTNQEIPPPASHGLGKETLLRFVSRALNGSGTWRPLRLWSLLVGVGCCLQVEEPGRV